MLKIEGLRARFPLYKSFRMCRSEGVMEVLILKGLREHVFGSADSKGLAGYRVVRPIIHALFYYESNRMSRRFWGLEAGS